MRRLALALPLLLLAAGCVREPWSEGQLAEGYRLCRAEAGFPPISVFAESGGSGFQVFMCTCEVSFLAERISHAHFTDGKHVPQVNNALGMARTSCLYRYRNGER